MANSVTTNIGRQKLASARAGEITLPSITKMAFGDEGVTLDGTPIPPVGTDIALNHELLRKDITEHSFPIATTCRYSCRLLKPDLADQKINEIALIDSDGDIVAIKTFRNKEKDADAEMVFEIDDEF